MTRVAVTSPYRQLAITLRSTGLDVVEAGSRVVIVDHVDAAIIEPAPDDDLGDVVAAARLHDVTLPVLLLVDAVAPPGEWISILTPPVSASDINHAVTALLADRDTTQNRGSAAEVVAAVISCEMEDRVEQALTTAPAVPTAVLTAVVDAAVSTVEVPAQRRPAVGAETRRRGARRGGGGPQRLGRRGIDPATDLASLAELRRRVEHFTSRFPDLESVILDLGRQLCEQPGGDVAVLHADAG